MIHSRRKNKLALALAVALGLASAERQALAVQIVEGGDGSTIYARLSKKEMTRLALEHGRIASLRVKQGELGIDPDDETGQLFLSVPDGANKPVNGFLTTDAGHTYTLVLQIVDAPADSIIIKQPGTAPTAPRGEFKAAGYDKAVKRMVSAMANDELPDDAQIKEIGRRLDLWQEAALTLERQYVAGELVGERYLVANVSQEAMVLDEREFYRKGVSAIALDQLNLAPGAATRLYVVREKSPNE
jgi:conjugal transfer pilus assembly protein TraK